MTHEPPAVQGRTSPWGVAERTRWRDERTVARSYETDVVARVRLLASRFDVETYGVVEQASGSYDLLAIRSRDWNPERPLVLVTGGVHGYETSGVLGALEFVERHGGDFDVDLLVAPCVSPWAYERIQRWNADALDPNRSFFPNSPAAECRALMALVEDVSGRVLLHIDLHETTDSDETEFRPALAARDGIDHQPGTIADGFYLCGDTDAPQLAFQAAIIDAVSKVTHIAPSDDNGQIIETDTVATGVILYPMRELGLSVSITPAPYRTLTEVYPDSASTTPEQCIEAQVTAVCAAIKYAVAKPPCVELR